MAQPVADRRAVRRAAARRRPRGTESAVINVWVDADVREHAAEAANRQGITLSLWLQQLIQRDRESSQEGSDHAAA